MLLYQISDTLWQNKRKEKDFILEQDLLDTLMQRKKPSNCGNYYCYASLESPSLKKYRFSNFLIVSCLKIVFTIPPYIAMEKLIKQLEDMVEKVECILRRL